MLIVVLAMATALMPGRAADAGDAFARALAHGAEAERRHDPQAALEHYRAADRLRPDDPFVLQKMAQQLSDSLFLAADAEQGRARVEEALRYAHRAAELDPSSAVNRLSLAILYGRLAAYGGVSEKVEYARRIRHHAEEAMTLDPGYAWACHVLGRWHLEMAALGSARRAVVAVLYGGLPKAAREEGLRLLERAVELEPEALAHRVELGLAYEKVGRSAEARAQWELSLKLPAVAIYDAAARQRALDALAQLDTRS